jgi:hypothetical protein
MADDIRLNETARKIAQSVLRGDYGEISGDSHGDSADSRGDSKMLLYGVGILAAVGIIGAGVYVWKNRQQ